MEATQDQITDQLREEAQRLYPDAIQVQVDTSVEAIDLEQQYINVSVAGISKQVIYSYTCHVASAFCRSLLVLPSYVSTFDSWHHIS